MNTKSKAENTGGEVIMPFKTENLEKIIEDAKIKDTAFQHAWDDSREEYRLIGEMIALRKSEHLSQTELANMSGTKQQAISRIEGKETKPSLRSFCNILNSMGYKLEIVKQN